MRVEPDWPGISDKEWDRIKGALLWFKRPPDRRRKRRRLGRPRVPDKTVFEAMLWAWGGGTLDRLPRRFGSQKTLRRRLKEWDRTGAADQLWQFYIQILPPEETARWAIRLMKKPRRQPFWQECLTVMFRAVHRDPFTRLAECSRPSPPPSAASTPPSSTPESSSPASSGP